jgi:hypothetical protein
MRFPANKEERLATAQSIRRFLLAAGHQRKYLVNREPYNLSESTVNKVFQGEFSERTLGMIEAMLGTSFTSSKEQIEKAPEDIGGYTSESVAGLQGSYLCVRPLFSNPAVLNAYLIQLSWDTVQTRLVFEERSRTDSKYAQEGVVYLPFGKPFIHLVSTKHGDVRMYTLSFPEGDGLSRGIVSTLSNPKGAIYIPVAAPVFLQRLLANETPQLGFVGPDNPCHSKYQDILASVTGEEFGSFVMNLKPADRRRGISIVSS